MMQSCIKMTTMTDTVLVQYWLHSLKGQLHSAIVHVFGVPYMYACVAGGGGGGERRGLLAHPYCSTR